MSVHVPRPRFEAPKFLIGALVCIAGVWLFLGCAAKKGPDATDLGSLASPIVLSKRIPPLFTDQVSELHYDLPVKNEIGRFVRFVRLQPSCACASGTNLAAMELAPGQETILHFEVNLGSRSGPQRFVCRLIEDGGVEWTCEVETTLYEGARFAVRAPGHFGMVDPGAEEVRETEFLLSARSASALPGKVSFVTDKERLEIEQGPAITEQQEDGVVIRRIPLRLHLHAPRVLGFGHVSIFAHLERQGLPQQVEATADWNVRTLYTVSPAQVYFGRVDSSAGPIERRIVIRNTQRQVVAVKGIKLDCRCVRCSVTKRADTTMAELLLVLDPTLLTKPLIAEVIVDLDDSTQPSLKIPVAALPKQAE
jgi:hypothetical protein